MRKKIGTLALLLLLVISVNAQEKIKVSCVGNSITYGMGVEGRETNSYPAQLQRMLGEEYIIGNFGKSGATLLERGHNPYIKQTEYQKALEFAGDIVVIHLGINDTDPRNWSNYKDEFIGDYLTLIESFKEVNPKARILIARMTPIGSQHRRFNSGTKIWHTQIQKAIENVASISGAQLIDLFEPLYSLPHLLPDAVHPNAEGAKIIADVIYQSITGEYGGLKLSPLYSNNMVLQRNTPLHINGTSNSGDKVTVSINGQKKRAVAGSDGEWSVTLKPMRAGGPYKLKISTKEEAKVLDNILIGEVWLCSGQSNMEWRVNQSKRSEGSNRVEADSKLRLFNMKSQHSTANVAWDSNVINSINNLQFYSQASWQEADLKAINSFSAVAFHFGEMLRDSLNVPIGLICNAIGGSNIESWIDRNTLESDFPLILPNWMNNDFIQQWARGRAAKNLENSKSRIKRHPYEPSYLYEAGIKPLDRYQIKGAIWYQGESNAHNIEAHEDLFPLLVKSWREYWNNDELPLYYVQLSSLNRPSWCWFRDSQRRLMEEIPHTGMAVSSDKGHPSDVHPRVKDVIGERLARWALSETYDLPIVASGPLVSGVEVKGGDTYVLFDYADGLTTSDNKKSTTFEVAEFDGVFYEADAEIVGNRIKLSCDKIKNIKHIRYGWQPYTKANLVNGDMLPASTFRHDLNN